MKLNAKVTALRTNGRAEITVVTSKTGLEQTLVVDNDGWALDAELTVLVLTKEQAADLHSDLVNLQGIAPVGAGTRTMLCDQLRPDEPPWESGKPRCTFVCMARDDVGGVDHRCLFPEGHSEEHAYSASCLLQRIQPTEVEMQEFRLGGAV